MKTLLVVFALLLLGIAGLGLYRGWFTFSMMSTDQKPSATFTVDKDKIHADEERVKERLQGFGNKATGTTGDLPTKDKQ